MDQPDQRVKMVPVDANQFEAVGFVESTRHLYVKFKNGPVMCLYDVPRFRYMGMMNSPRKDAYYNTYIKNSFLAKEAQLPRQF